MADVKTKTKKAKTKTKTTIEENKKIPVTGQISSDGGLTTVSDLDALIAGDPVVAVAAIDAIGSGADALIARVPDLVSHTDQEREDSNGRIGGAHLALLPALLDGVDENPALFASIADKDHGTDQARVETEPTRRALALITALDAVLPKVAALARRLGDLRMSLGERVMDVTGPSYKIAKANMDSNPKLRRRIAPLVSLLQSRGKHKGAAKKPPAGK